MPNQDGKGHNNSNSIIMNNVNQITSGGLITQRA